MARTQKIKAWDKFAKFSADFETTAHKEFTDDEFLANDRSTFAINETPIDFKPNESSKVFLCGLMSLKDYTYKLSFENLAIFINNIVELTYQEHKSKALIYFHNLGYDGEYLLRWLIYHGYKQTLNIDSKTHRTIILRKQFALLKSGGKFFSLTFWWRGIKLHFLDSLKLFPKSLASLGESIGYKKLKDDIDYKKFKIYKDHKYPKKWLDYLKRDCEILARYLNQFFEKEQNSHSLYKQTIGSIAYSYIKDTINKLTPNFTIKDYNYFQQWYSGGLSFPSLIYWSKWVYKPNRIKMIDACSMYPSQMIKPLPYGKALKTKPKSGTYCCFYEIKIIKAIIKKKYDDIAILKKPFEYVKNKKVYHFTKFNTLYQYIQEVENEKYYFIDCELEMLNKFYDIKYKILKRWYFRTDAYLKSTIKDLFKYKQLAKEQNDEVNTLLSKLRLNNLYGKTGQKPIRHQDFYGDIEDLPDNYEVVGNKNTLIKGYNIQQIKDENYKANPIFLASYITALARCSLLEKYLYIKSKGGIFLYCDTDSICYIDSIKSIKFKDIGNELGHWEFEKFKTADAFCCLCPKQYRIVKNKQIVKLATAGVKKELMLKVKNQDYNYDLGTNNKYHIIKTTLKESIYGKVIWESPFNFFKWKKIKSNPICPKELIND